METHYQQKIIIPIHTPVISVDKLADIWTPRENNLDGDIRLARLVTMKTRISNQVSTGVLPSFHIGKRIAINLPQLAQNDADSRSLITSQKFTIDFTLLLSSMPMDAFAEHAGYDYGVVEGWVRKGYIPSNKHGSYRMVNMLHLLDRCLTWRADQWSDLSSRTSPQSKPVPAVRAV